MDTAAEELLHFRTVDVTILYSPILIGAVGGSHKSVLMQGESK
jgi:hypothetical protein